MVIAQNVFKDFPNSSYLNVRPIFPKCVDRNWNCERGVCSQATQVDQESHRGQQKGKQRCLKEILGSSCPQDRDWVERSSKACKEKLSRDIVCCNESSRANCWLERLCL